MRKYFYFRALFLVVTILAISCNKDPELPIIVNPEIKEIEGMRIIRSKGVSFTIGSDDLSFASDERPAMPVSLSYDFYIDTTEVTQSEYTSVTAKTPVPAGSKYGIGPQFPVYYVSWFDAILFCNEKSKMNHRDTVYTYNEIQKNTTGSVINIVGLRINYQFNGYRLPTEAEWEFVAKEGLKNKNQHDSIYAWYSINAQGQTHSVASKAPNYLGIYDMSGNVYEWTNDWKSMHSNKSILNPIGAATPNREFERVLKGGAFLKDIINTRPSARSSTYPTSAPSSTEYIGFRCVIGGFSPSSFVSDDTPQHITNPVDLVTANVAQYTFNLNTRLVFVNVTGSRRTLCYVNYADAVPLIHEFMDRTDVYMPTISPDGKFVAFCTADEGLRQTATSKVYIRSLDSINLPIQMLPAEQAFVPRWWIDLSTKDTFIVYTNSAIDCDAAEWTSTKTLIQKMSNGKPVGSPQTIISNGSFHDGASPDGHYIVTGQSKLKMKHMTDGAVKQLFISPLNGKPANGSTQVCNVSMSPDSTLNGYCMFLDFGSSETSTLIKSSYGVHEYLFIGNYTGEIVKWIKCPTGEKSWEHPEWSNKINFAVSAAEAQNGNKNNIYLIKIKQDKADITRLIKGENLAHPYIWLSKDFSTPFDSSCRYDLPLTSWNQETIALKMAGFWKCHDSMETIFSGTSHTYNGIDPASFSRKVYNLAVSGYQLQEVFSVINDYILNHCKKVRLIGMDIIFGRFFVPEYNASNLALQSSTGYNFDKNNNFWKDSIPFAYTKAISKLPLPDNYQNALLQCIQAPCTDWGGTVPAIEASKEAVIDGPEFTFNWNLFKATADTLAKRKIHFLLIITPESPYYKSTLYYGRQGPQRDVARTILERIRELEKNNPYLHLYDANIEGDHDYTDAEALNCDHLCPEGAKKLSKRVDSLITRIYAQ